MALAAKNDKDVERIHKLHELFNLIAENDRSTIKKNVIAKIKEIVKTYVVLEK